MVDTQWSNVSIGGASGTGKSSFLNLLLLKDPIFIHDSTPVLKSLDICIVDEKHKESSKQKEATLEEEESDDDEEDEFESESIDHCLSESSDDEVDVPTTTREMRQHMIIADSSDEHLWKIAEKDALQMELAEAVSAMTKEDMIEENCPPRMLPYCPKSISSNSSDSTALEGPTATPLPSSNNRAQPIAITPEKLTARQQILELLPLIKHCSTLGRTHWIHLLDSGGQANFIDIAPALFRFNSVNIVLHKLDEELDDMARFFYSIEGEVVGTERRRITNAQLLRSLFASRMGLKQPNLDGLAGVEIAGEAHLVVLGTHFDKYLEKLQKGEISETLRIKNDRFLMDFKDYKQWIIQFKPAKKPKIKPGKKGKSKGRKAELIFPVNSLSREEREKKIAQQIRKLASHCYIRAKVPIRWFFIQIEINELKSSGKDIVSLEKVLNIGFCLQMSRQEVIASLRYFHDLTVCLYFHKVLPGVIFLTPNRLFKKLTQLASVTLRSRKSAVPLGIFEKLSQHGIFTREVFDYFPEEFESGLFTVENFLEVMEHLFIICPLPDGESYYIPSVLESIDNPVNDLDEAFFRVEPLCLSWKDTVPVGLFPSLTQYLQGRTNDDFVPQTSADNYRNRVSLCFTKTYDEVVMFEMPGFIGIAHNAPAHQSSFIRKKVLEGIQHIVKAFNWKEEIAKPTESYLCRVVGCEYPSNPHLCNITADSCTLVCSLNYKRKMSIDKICYLPWRGESIIIMQIAKLVKLMFCFVC